MKTTFETNEEKIFLRKLLTYTIMYTERFIFLPLENEKYYKQQKLSAYCKIIKETRKKCFEYLEEEDPNQHIIDSINYDPNL